jgi:hypothetical protein
MVSTIHELWLAAPTLEKTQVGQGHSESWDSSADSLSNVKVLKPPGNLTS